MPNFREHFEHSSKRYPKINEKRHKSTHKWMDNPANWTVGDTYPSGWVRKNGYNGYTHRNIRHNAGKVANALCGGKKNERRKPWHEYKKIAKDHLKLDNKKKK